MKSGTALATCTATPYGGRAGQYWSEDPTLDYFNGYYEAQAMQGVGVTMCVKHMCCNDQEAQRTGLSVFVDEQALRETYLRAFEGSFAGGALSVMATTGRVGPTLGKNYEAMMTTSCGASGASRAPSPATAM